MERYAEKRRPIYNCNRLGLVDVPYLNILERSLFRVGSEPLFRSVANAKPELSISDSDGQHTAPPGKATGCAVPLRRCPPAGSPRLSRIRTSVHGTGRKSSFNVGPVDGSSCVAPSLRQILIISSSRIKRSPPSAAPATHQLSAVGYCPGCKSDERKFVRHNVDKVFGRPHYS